MTQGRPFVVSGSAADALSTFRTHCQRAPISLPGASALSKPLVSIFQIPLAAGEINRAALFLHAAASACEVSSRVRCDQFRGSFQGLLGEAFILSAPRMCQNVQLCHEDAYHRRSIACECGVRASLFMPLYETAARTRAAAVIEIALVETDVLFVEVMEALSMCLQVCEIFYRVHACAFFTTCTELL